MLTLLALIPASDLAVTVLNWDVTHFFPPRLLREMETESGIPQMRRRWSSCQPFFSRAQVKELLGTTGSPLPREPGSEYLLRIARRFPDADSEETSDDSAAARNGRQSGIDELNRRHHNKWLPHFISFTAGASGTRRGQWMGWERKRGKLEEFNRLLRGASDTSFIVRTADDTLLCTIRYVITLDSDTQLPRDVARKLVGAAAHPLNRPALIDADD